MITIFSELFPSQRITPPYLSNVLKYISKAYFVRWVFYLEMHAFPKRLVVVIGHYHRHWSEGHQPFLELSLGPQPHAGNPNFGDFSPPMKTPPWALLHRLPPRLTSGLQWNSYPCPTQSSVTR